MGHFVVGSSPIIGHLAPLLPVATELRRRGHRVQVLTGSRFSERVTAAGLEHVSLPQECDFDAQDLDAAFPERTTKKGVSKLRFDIDNLFANSMPHQYRAVQTLLAPGTVDAVLVDSAFCGVLPLALQPKAQRPAVYTAGVVPMYVASRDTPPIGLGLQPMAHPVGRVRDAVLNALVRKVLFAPCHRVFADRLREAAGVELPVYFMNGSLLTDAILQLTCESFEFPRHDLPPGVVSFVGPILPSPPETFEPPSWWADLDGRKPVVLVTQGTIDNNDFSRLIVPALQALADADVVTVATTGGKALPSGVPTNARVADFIPYAHLLPKVDVMITNGGYGGIHFALTHGVPMVVGGDSEGNQDSAALVSWSGTGINLRNGSPKPAAIRKAVDKVLTDPSYRNRAQELQRELAGLSAVTTIADRMESAMRERVSS
ncbi:glycosyltransferase [Micromonospora andamanensis]|uniref:glycosyltransferase n=1 Tax=Micromonospora andamanensis TaxID=1287068 RepID=UPI001951D6FE|nr:nucleotide disphospho-sugar-binding domain-containing protein [Micromonospora andamanensis]GIJ41666.1 glycosyl transferase [Micromonospora andamanensis]